MRIPTDPGSWITAPIDTLLDHVVAVYHAPLLTALESTAVALTRAANLVNPSERAVIACAAQRCATLIDLATDHVFREADLVFPCLRHGNRAAAALFITQIERDHTRMRTYYEQIRSMVAPSGLAAFHATLTNLERLLDGHVWFEDNVLFPRALAGAGE